MACHVHRQRSFSKLLCPQHPRETGQGYASLGCCILASAELRPGISSTADGRGPPMNPHGPAITPAIRTGAFYRAPISSLIPQLTKQRCQIQLKTIPGDQNTQPHRQLKKKGFRKHLTFMAYCNFLRALSHANSSLLCKLPPSPCLHRRGQRLMSPPTSPSALQTLVVVF